MLGFFFAPPAPKTVEEKVDDGASFMDSVHPGWAREIDERTLDISYEEDCVMGQLYGRYSWGCLRHHLSKEDSIRFGFNIPPAAGDHAFEHLTRTWLTEIRKRKAALTTAA